MRLLKHYLLFFLTSLLIVAIWFSGKQLLAGGEEGLSIFNDRSLSTQIWPWQGYNLGIGSTIYPNKIVPVAIIKALAVSPEDYWIFQAGMYFVLILTGLIGMYHFTSLFVQDKTQLGGVSFIAPPFYFFNLFTMTQVFNRFIYSYIFTRAYLPLFLYMFIKWMQSLKFYWLIFIILTSLLFSYAFTNPANVMTLWLGAAVWTIIDIIKNRKNIIVF